MVNLPTRRTPIKGTGTTFATCTENKKAEVRNDQSNRQNQLDWNTPIQIDWSKYLPYPKVEEGFTLNANTVPQIKADTFSIHLFYNGTWQDWSICPKLDPDWSPSRWIDHHTLVAFVLFNLVCPAVLLPQLKSDLRTTLFRMRCGQFCMPSFGSFRTKHLEVLCVRFWQPIS